MHRNIIYVRLEVDATRFHELAPVRDAGVVTTRQCGQQSMRSDSCNRTKLDVESHRAAVTRPLLKQYILSAFLQSKAEL